MMDSQSVYVVDTSVLIDIYHGGVLQEFPQLPYRFITPDVIIAEIVEPRGKTLVEKGLQERELTGDQVLQVRRFAAKYRRPSRNDIFALVLAKELQVVLLTGDRYLREAAEQEGIQVHGTLWALDEMVRLRVITKFRAADSLENMLSKGSRLPLNECRKRLSRWRAN